MADNNPLILSQEAVTQLFLTKLKNILASEKNINEAVDTRVIIHLDGKKTNLEKAKDQFDEKGNIIASENPRLVYHEQARALNERKQDQLKEMMSEREKIAFSSAYFTAAQSVSQDYLMSGKIAQDRFAAEKLTAMIDNARLATAQHLKQDLGFKDPAKGYEVKDQANARITELQNNSQQINLQIACNVKLNEISKNIVSKVKSLSGSKDINIESAFAWINNPINQIKVNGNADLKKAVNDHAKLNELSDALKPAQGNAPDPKARVNNFLEKFSQWRQNDYKGPHGIKVSMFQQAPSPIYSLWKDSIKPLAKLHQAEQKAGPKKI